MPKKLICLCRIKVKHAHTHTQAIFDFVCSDTDTESNVIVLIALYKQMTSNAFVDTELFVLNTKFVSAS